uniref:glycosyltransferase n=1 Tax=uncultured Draconibacterium sp. TaxID=1573823 RepID=UPI0032173814
MKILVNTSNLKMGGAIQVGISFINEIREERKHCFHIVLSKEISQQVNTKQFPSNFSFYDYSVKANRVSAYQGKNKFLSQLENAIKPDCVFSIFSPTYWKPRSLHIAGFAAGWTINPDSIAFRQLKIVDRIKKNLQNYLKLKLSITQTDIFIGETQVVRERLNKFGKFPINKIHVVGNTFGSHFNKVINTADFRLPIKRESDEFRFVTISANYPHKNLKILKSVIPILRRKKVNVKFILTLPNQEFNQIFSDFDDYIINLGPVPINACPGIYAQCDALFLPTLLESFTASYPEAMIMQKPILTSNLDFAKDICKDAAEYFEPLNQQDIVQKIMNLINNEKRYNELIRLGLDRVKDFPTAKKRAEKYIEICEQEVNRYHDTNHTS